MAVANAVLPSFATLMAAGSAIDFKKVLDESIYFHFFNEADKNR